MKNLLLTGICGIALLAAACSGGHPASHSSGRTDSDAKQDTGSLEADTMGVPAAGTEADRTIKIVMLDELVYQPAQIKVSTGEVVTFEIVNEGKLQHEFVLGDRDYQAMHEQEMAGGAHHVEMKNGLSLGPGGSGALTWRFTQRGEVLYGCHEQGHYEGGMVGKISVG